MSAKDILKILSVAWQLGIADPDALGYSGATNTFYLKTPIVKVADILSPDQHEACKTQKEILTTALRMLLNPHTSFRNLDLGMIEEAFLAYDSAVNIANISPGATIFLPDGVSFGCGINWSREEKVNEGVLKVREWLPPKTLLSKFGMTLTPKNGNPHHFLLETIQKGKELCYKYSPALYIGGKYV